MERDVVRVVYPAPVKQVKFEGKGRLSQAGIPTVSDRVGRTVAKLLIEPILDPRFHPDSYGYHRTIGETGDCHHQTTVLAILLGGWFDIKGAFDHIDHGLWMKAVSQPHPRRLDSAYIERWLTAPFEAEEAPRVPRNVVPARGCGQSDPHENLSCIMRSTAG